MIFSHNPKPKPSGTKIELFYAVWPVVLDDGRIACMHRVWRRGVWTPSRFPEKYPDCWTYTYSELTPGDWALV